MILLRNQRILAELIKTNAVFDEISLNSVNLSMIMLIPLYLDEFKSNREESEEISINSQKNVDYIYKKNI